MTVINELEAFVRGGFEHYPAARDAVDTFEGEVQNRLMTLLEKKQDWQHFTPKRGGRGRGKAVSFDTWGNGRERTRVLPRPARAVTWSLWICSYGGARLPSGTVWSWCPPHAEIATSSSIHPLMIQETAYSLACPMARGVASTLSSITSRTSRPSVDCCSRRSIARLDC